ncbi:hypothetical protein DFH94DRAFT_635179 [Russula ochroleuca]|uniref:Uncharacterized protein n=1 Tax=Russula ochroleuca TaxID=152965 RepID=A0A9P5MS29_9AGAM|nr:hypothetical protein DFH94DRAFT_641155 [Russula ochroleuca]KAF8463244.1 hypothetical protein DFH94DRAFT_640485 [Russula ochroleuca]KAF8476465.1 hypothetical protein DFH94DRAFT_635179 [Russula ochroleuca]
MTSLTTSLPPLIPSPSLLLCRSQPFSWISILLTHQYLDPRLPILFHSRLASHTFFHPSFAPLRTISPLLYDSHSLPLYPYTRASSSYSAVVQLYACSGQLPTSLSRATRFHEESMLCRFGCQSLEDVHHIFARCPVFQDLRDEYSKMLIADSERVLCNLALPGLLSSHLDRVITHLFCDDSL